MHLVVRRGSCSTNTPDFPQKKLKMLSSKGKRFAALLSLYLVCACLASHFRGGIISWEPVDPANFDGRVSGLVVFGSAMKILLSNSKCKVSDVCLRLDLLLQLRLLSLEHRYSMVGLTALAR